MTMTKRHRWSVVWLVLALAACDGPADTDAGVDARVDPEDGGETTPDGGPADPPAVTSATPTDIARGATLVIAGTDLTEATAVTIGGAAQTIGDNGEASITIDGVAGETPLGAQDLVVTTAAGESEPIAVTILEALGVAGAAAADSTTVTVMFTRALDAVSVEAADFTIDGLEVSAAVASGSIVTLTTAPQSAAAAYTVEVAGVTDVHGNLLSGASSAGFAGFSPDAPTIVTISAGEVVRGFSQLTVTGTHLSNATVEIGGTAQTNISNTDTEVVVGPIDLSTPLGTQMLVATTPGGTSGSMNVSVLEAFQIVEARAVSSTAAEVTFNRDVDPVTVAPEHFTVVGLTVSAATASGATVTLTTTEQTEGASYTISADSRVRDLGGAPVTADAWAFLGFVPPPPTELIVVRVGDGATSLSGSAAPVFLERRALADGALLSTLALPTAPAGANHPLTLSGNQSSEGGLTLSQDRRLLAIGGYQAAPGDPTSSANDPRVVAVIDAADFGATPSIDTTTTMGSAFASTRPWGAVIDGTDIWVSGGFGGIHHCILGMNSNTQLFTPNGTNSAGRAIAIFEGQLYYTTSSTAMGVMQVGTGLPTGPAAATPLFMVSTAMNPYSFSGFDRDPAEPGVDTFYVANNGVERWVKSGGTWALSANFGPTSVTRVSCFEDGLDVVCAGGDSGELFHMRDTGGTSAGSDMEAFMPSVTAAANTAFRGIAFAPIP